MYEVHNEIEKWRSKVSNLFSQVHIPIIVAYRELLTAQKMLCLLLAQNIWLEHQYRVAMSLSLSPNSTIMHYRNN